MDPAAPNGSHRPETISDSFHRFSRRISQVLGNPWSFGAAVIVTVIWALTGPFFDFSDTWQLVANTATTIITFLMVFLIQNTQNRDAKALHLKLDELLRGLRGARNQLIDLEDLSDEELTKLEVEFRAIRERAGAEQTGEPED